MTSQTAAAGRGRSGRRRDGGAPSCFRLSRTSPKLSVSLPTSTVDLAFELSFELAAVAMAVARQPAAGSTGAGHSCTVAVTTAFGTKGASRAVQTVEAAAALRREVRPPRTARGGAEREGPTTVEAAAERMRLRAEVE